MLLRKNQILLLFLLFLNTFAFAASSTVSNESTPPIQTSTVNSKETNRYNQSIKDSGNPIENAQKVINIVNMMYGSSIYSKNRGDVSSDANAIIGRKEKSLHSFNKELRMQLESDMIDNSSVGISKSKNELKCFISRDIPFQYKCSKTNITYGGRIGVSGKKALIKCKSECYDQNICYNAAKTTATNMDPEIKSKNNKFTFSDENQTYDTTYNVDASRKLQRIGFKIVFEDKNGKSFKNKKYVYVNIYVTEKGKTEQQMLMRNRISSVDPEAGFYVDQYVSKIRFEFFNEKNIGFKILPKVKAYYLETEKWFCPAYQDVNSIPYKGFAKQCPNGKITKVSDGGHHFASLCSNGEKAGDNADGTFSNKGSCQSICRQAYRCEAVQSITSTNQLKSFNEGCIAGQGNCKEEECKAARITGLPIIDEVVFDAKMEPTITVKDGEHVGITERPRITNSETLDFEHKNIEEWKDKAYADMVKNHRYVKTKRVIGQNTDKESAVSFSVGENGSNQLIWDLKPRAFDVNNNKQFYLYAVLEIDFEYWAYNSKGIEVPFRDKVYYLKSSLNDTFKPFVRFKDYGKVTVGSRGTPTVSKNEYSIMKYQTFSGKNWINLSSSLNAPYFKIEKFDEIKFFSRETVINDMGNYNYFLPGMIRSSKKTDLSTINYYNGDFDGTGDNIARTAVHVYYSPTKLSYSDVYEDILNENDKNLNPKEDNVFFKIHDTGLDEPSIFKLESDSEQSKKESINIYRYGPIDKTSAYFTIKTPSELLGQKGFIYVLLY